MKEIRIGTVEYCKKCTNYRKVDQIQMGKKVKDIPFCFEYRLHLIYVEQMFNEERVFYGSLLKDGKECPHMNIDE